MTAPPLIPGPPAGQPATAAQDAENASAGGTGVVGVVLAGGLSSRLGEDKARLRLVPLQPCGCLRAAAPFPAETALPAPQDQDLLTRTVRLLRACTDDVAVSCRAARDARPWRRILDEEEGSGPVGALCSVFRAEQRPVLVLPCDLPFMTEEVLRRLLAARATRPSNAVMTAFRQVETGRIEPLVAVYEPACRPWFEAALAAGKRRLGAVVPERLRVCVPYWEEEALPFFNLNSPADLEAARRLAERQGASRA